MRTDRSEMLYMYMLAGYGKLHVHRQVREATCVYWYGKLHVHRQVLNE